MGINSLYMTCLWSVVKNRLTVGLVPPIIDDHINMIKTLADAFETRKISYGNYHAQLTRLCQITSQMNGCYECGLFPHWMNSEGQCESHSRLMTNGLRAQSIHKYEYGTSTSMYRLQVRKCEKCFPELIDLVKRKIEAQTRFELALWWEI